MRRICVFCGSSLGARPAYREAAVEVGALLARRGLGLVYGGGNIGLMGALADATLEAGGEAIGVIPQALVAKEVAHRGLTELRVVETMHERKALMASLADAFLALPGGYGTLEEFIEAVTWSQLGIHRKPCGLLNVEGYFDPLLEFFDRAAAERFFRPENRALVLSGTDAAALIDDLLSYELPRAGKWLGDFGDSRVMR
jgi:uncharacterized protein (TIGR00730 family)